MTTSSCAAPSPIRSPTSTRPVAMPMRACNASPAGVPSPATAAAIASSGPHCALGIVLMRLGPAKLASTPSPMYLATRPRTARLPPRRCFGRPGSRPACPRSSREASSVEPTKSTNMIVSCRRSASGRALAGAGSVRSGAGATGSLASASPCSAAMASSSRRRCPTDVMSSAIRSSAVSRDSTSASIWLA